LTRIGKKSYWSELVQQSAPTPENKEQEQMAIIGQFTKNEDSYEGRIKTLQVELKDVKVTPLSEGAKASSKSPDFEVTSKDITVGAGWKQTAKVGGKEYIRVSIDDPSMEKPLYASLIEDSGGIFNMIWSRSRKS